MAPEEKRVYKIAIVDDHTLFRTAIKTVIASFSDSLEVYKIMIEAESGRDLLASLKSEVEPDLLFLDLNMPEMDGFEVLKFVASNHPRIRVIILSMYTDPKIQLATMQRGANSYLIKNVYPEELKTAIQAVMKQGYYITEELSKVLAKSVRQQFLDSETVRPQPMYLQTETENSAAFISLNEREKTFMKLLCTEMTYKEIAEKMFLSVRTIDNYRDSLFDKFKVKSRVGLILSGIKHNILALPSNYE